MKARIKKTGEIVDIISFSSTKDRHIDDCVQYFDKDGNRHTTDRNYYLDFEPIQEKEIDWEQRTWEAVLAYIPLYVHDVEYTVKMAKYLIEEYKKQMDL